MTTHTRAATTVAHSSRFERTAANVSPTKEKGDEHEGVQRAEDERFDGTEPGDDEAAVRGLGGAEAIGRWRD